METKVTAKCSRVPLTKERECVGDIAVCLYPPLLMTQSAGPYYFMSQDAHLVYVDDTHLESPSTYTAQGRVKVTATHCAWEEESRILLRVVYLAYALVCAIITKYLRLGDLRKTEIYFLSLLETRKAKVKTLIFGV